MAELFFAEGRLTESRILVDSIDSLGTFEEQQYSQFMSVLLDLELDTIVIPDMDSVQEQVMRDVASTSTEIAVRAEVVVSLIDGLEFDHPIIKPQQVKLNPYLDEEEAADITIKEALRIDDFSLSNYPNPFSEGTIIAAYVPDHFESLVLLSYMISWATKLDLTRYQRATTL